jgi:hypothetical protein
MHFTLVMASTVGAVFMSETAVDSTKAKAIVLVSFVFLFLFFVFYSPIFCMELLAHEIFTRTCK